jgi:hypothetical protein
MNKLSFFPRFSRDLTTLAVVAVPVLVALMPRTAHADEAQPGARSAEGEHAGGEKKNEPAKAAPAPDSSTAPVPAPAPAAVVQLEADDNRATIERRVGTQTPTGLPLLETGIVSVGQWEQACVAPCTMKLDTRYSYRVAGDGLVPTDSFSLPRSGDHVRVDAKMGSSTGRALGIVATVGGALAVAAGGAALIATPILKSEDVGSEGFRTAVLAGGVSALSLGVVAVGIGTLLWLSNGSTAQARVASR